MLRLWSAVHFNTRGSAHTPCVEKRAIRSSLAPAPDIGACFSIRSLAPYQIRATLPKLVRSHRRRSITYKLYHLARLRPSPQQFRAFPGSDIICQGHCPNPSASVSPAPGEGWTIHQSLGSVREPVVLCADTPFCSYILVREATEVSGPIHCASSWLY
jgi:hypothetical protein